MISKVALFSFGGSGFALAVEQIDRIVPEPRISALPLLPPGFCGVFTFRDEAVPMLDSRRELGLPGPEDFAALPYAVILHTEAGRVGLPTDRVVRIVDRAQGTLEEAEEREGAERARRCFVLDSTRYPFPDMESFIAKLACRTHPGALAEGTRRIE